MQPSTIIQSENFPLVESDFATPGNNKKSNIMGEVKKIFSFSCIEMTETPDIDKVLLNVETNQKSVNEFFITDNWILR